MREAFSCKVKRGLQKSDDGGPGAVSPGSLVWGLRVAVNVRPAWGESRMSGGTQVEAQLIPVKNRCS